MRARLSGSLRKEREFRVYRARIAGSAILGIAVVTYWLGRLAGIW